MRCAASMTMQLVTLINKLSGAIFVLNEFHSLGASTSLMARAVRRMHVRTKDAVWLSALPKFH